MMRMASDKENTKQKTGKTVKLDPVHWKIIRGLIPFYGNSEPEVVRTIVIQWIHGNIGSEPIRKLEELEAIQFK